MLLCGAVTENNLSIISKGYLKEERQYEKDNIVHGGRCIRPLRLSDNKDKP